MGGFKEDPKPGIPAWLVSFGDMMTLILTFFILLVSLANTQQPNGMARGVGSFQARLRSHGLPGLLDGDERAQIFNEVRARFNLPPEEDPERRALDLDSAAVTELMVAETLKKLGPRIDLRVPALVAFHGSETQLDAADKRSIDALASTLDLHGGQVLVLEVPHVPIPARSEDESHWIAHDRAESVRRYLAEVHALSGRKVRVRGTPRLVKNGPEGECSVSAAVWASHADS